MKRHLAKPFVRFFLGIVLMALIGGGIFILKKGDGGLENNAITVTRGDIVQEVIVTGKIEPEEDVKLAFERTGKIQSVDVKIGDRVKVGTSLARLDTSELSTQLSEAQANVLAQQAKLDELLKGTRKEDIQVKEVELRKAEQDLANLYDGVPTVLESAYAQADDAVRKQLNELFTNDEELNPQLSFSVNDAQAKNNAEFGRLLARNELVTWRGELDALRGVVPYQKPLDEALQTAEKRLEVIRYFLQDVALAVQSSININQELQSLYKASVNTARTNINSVLTGVHAKKQEIASEQIVVQRIQSELDLKRAGSTPEQIAAQEALVQQSEAKEQSIRVQIAKSTLRSPIGGIVTRQDAKVGEISSPTIPVIYIISESGLKIEVNIPEVDIARVHVDNNVRITLDALPGEGFLGRVTHIDPAETIVDGVVNFKVTVAFQDNDPRFKSGLTANLTIRTLEKKGVLTLPQYALLEADKGIFVRKVVNGNSASDVPVQLGIRSQDGMVEILSGIQEGDKVLNVGVKNGIR